VTSLRTLNQRLHIMEESIKPGSAVVRSLRATHPAAQRLTRSEVRGALVQAGQRVAAASASMGGLYLSEAAIDPMEDQRIQAILMHSGLDSWKVSVLKPILEKAWSRSALLTEQALEKHGIYAGVRRRVSEKMRETGATRTGLVDMDSGTEAALRKVLEVARELGVSPRDAGRLIEHYVPAGRFVHAGSGYRSRMIATTETLEASRHGSLAVYGESPVVDRVMAFDGVEHDAQCEERDGEIFTLPQAEMENSNTHPSCVLAWGPM
jgi:hypothetical protein